MQCLRGAAFSGVRAPQQTQSRARTVCVRAVQDLQGKVVSTKMNRSAVVAVERLSPHDRYMKRTRITKNYTVRDSVGVAEGDYVRLEGCRPLSKTIRFTVAEVLRKAE